MKPARFFPPLFAALLSAGGCTRDPMPEPAIIAGAPVAQSDKPGPLAGAPARSDKPRPLASAVDGDTFVDASLGDASLLNPVLASDSASVEICNYVFNGLVKYDKDLRLVGDLAASWDVRRDGREIVFHLRKNIRWHDGKPFTAADVVFTYQRLIDPAVKTPFGADFELVKSVAAPDPLTVRVIYKEPFAPALESWGMGILPKHVFQGGDFNNHPANRRPIGTGPYRFSTWNTDEKIVLTANPGYFEGRPHMDRIIYRIIPDGAVQFLEMRNQSIDSLGLTPDQYQAYPEFFTHYNKYRYPSFSYVFFAFNLRIPLFQDARVRRAFTYALDKRELIDGVLLGFGRAATGPFPPASWAYNPAVPDDVFDPEKAKALLKAAGWSDSNGDGILDKKGQKFEFTVITNQGNKPRELTAVILQSRLRKLGIVMKVRVLEWSSFIHDYVDKNKFDAMILGWNLSRDPDQYVIWHSSQRDEGKYNFVGYVNPEADRLWEAGRREFDFKKRRAIYRKLHKILHDDAPYVFLYYPESLPAIHKRIQGPAVAAAGMGWNFREWFVPKSQQRYHYAP